MKQIYEPKIVKNNLRMVVQEIDNLKNEDLHKFSDVYDENIV